MGYVTIVLTIFFMGVPEPALKTKEKKHNRNLKKIKSGSVARVVFVHSGS